LFSKKYIHLCQTFYSDEFKKASGNEKPIVLMGTGIPMKGLIESLNK